MSVENGKKVILAVDDVSLNLLIIKDLLSKYFDVRIAKSGELALSILGSMKVDLILLDIEMPGMSGFDFINIMRGIPDSKDIPIICVTSHAKEYSVRKAILAGVRDYIIKPIDSKILIETVFGILDMPLPDK